MIHATHKRKYRKLVQILISLLLRFNTTQSPSNEYFFSGVQIYISSSFSNVLLPATFQNNRCGCVAEYWNDMSIVFFITWQSIPLSRVLDARQKFNLAVSRDTSRKLNINFYFLSLFLYVLNAAI